MKQLSLAVIAFLFISIGARAQSGFTTVTATVLDPTGVPYASCSGNASFVPSPSATQVPTIGGSTFPTTAVIAACDSFGKFTLVLADNNQVVDGHTSPPASQWRFSISAQGGSPSFPCVMTITGVTQDISSQMQVCAAPLPTPKANSFASVTTQQSATPNFTGNGNTGFIYLLNQNVTSSTFTTNAAAGTSPVYQFNICQDSVGGHTMVWPSNVTLPPNYVFNLVPNSCSPVSFIYNPNTAKWTPWQVISPLGASLPFSTVPFTATPSFFGTPTGVAYGITLTGNVTSSAVSGAPANGNVMKFHICQGGGGPWTFAFPANFLNTTAIQNSGCTDETYSFDGTNWTQLTQPAGGGGGGGGSCSAAGAQGTVQAAGTAGACQSTNIVEVGSVAKIGDDAQFAGPNPWIDARVYARQVSSLSTMVTAGGVTATCTSGLPTVSLSIASDFLNGDGVNILHCGANNSGTTPTAPTVTASGMALGTGTRIAKPSVAPTAGSTTYSYVIVGVTKGRGTSLPSSVTTITNGQASLGTQTVTNSSIAVSGTTATVTTSSAHTLSPGYEINIAGTTDANGNGLDGFLAGNYSVLAVPDSTHFTYTIRQSTLNGAPTSASTGGTTTWTNVNHIAVTASGGYDFYIVYDNTANRIVCLTEPVNSSLGSDQAYLSCDDSGSTLETGFSVPEYASATVPVAATNDSLTTTIVSGAGSTNLTLNANAGASTSGTIHYDAGPNWITAATAAVNAGTSLYLSATSGNNIWFNDSYLNWPSGTRLIQQGSVQIGDTWNVFNMTSWRGNYGAGCVRPQFAITCAPNVLVQSAYPGVYGSLIFLNNLTFSSATTNNPIPLVLLDFSNDMNIGGLNFAGSGSSNENLFIGLELRGRHDLGINPFSNVATDLSFIGGPNTSSPVGTPLFYCNSCASMTFDHMSFGKHGMIFRTRDGGGQITIHWAYNQGGQTPFIRAGYADAGTSGLTLNIDNTTQDTTAQPVFASLLGANSSVTIVNANGTGVRNPGGSPPTASGNMAGLNLNFAGNRGAVFGANTMACNVNPLLDTVFSFLPTSVIFDNVCSFSNPVFVTPGYSLFMSDINLTAPTCSVAAAGPPFTPAGTYTFAYAAVWPNSGIGTLSARSSSCVANGTTQQITVTMPSVPPAGSSGWAVYWDQGPAGSSFPSTTTATYLFTSPNGGGVPSIPSGGPAGMQNGKTWTNVLNLGQYQDVAETTAPANPATGFDRFYADSTTHKLNCLTTTGANCLFPYAINSYSGNHVLIISEQAAVATASGITFTLPHAAAGRAWDIYNTSAGTITLTIDSGTLSGGGATGPIILQANTGVRASCDGTNCDVLGVGGGGGGGCTPGGITNALQYNGGGPCSFGGVNSPTVNGNYVVNYNVVASAAVPPTINLPGVPVNAQTGTTYTIGAANTWNDRATLITATNAGAQTYSMVNPTNIGFGSNMPYSIWNRGSGAVTENASGFTVNGGASLLIPPNWVAPHWSDGVNWFSVRYPSFEAWPSCLDSGGNHLNFNSTTGVIICGTSASGNGLSGMTAGQVPIAATATTVTSSEALAGAGAAITTGPASSTSLDVVEFTGTGGQIADAGFLASNVVRKDAAATLGAFLYDFSASTMKVPTGAGATASASSMLIYDSTNKNLHVYANNADAINCAFSSTPTTGDLVSATVSSSNVLCSDASILATNVVTNSTGNAAAANQILVSAGADKTAKAIDFPDSKSIPFAICVNGTAATGVTTTTAVGGTCRAGTNNKDAFVGPFTTSDSATFKVHLPKDWDTGTAPSLSIDLASTDATSGHTIILQVATECSKLDGSTTDDVAFNAAQSMGTITLNTTANQTWTTTLASLTTTGCSAPGIMWVKITRTTDTATNVELYEADITIPRRLTVQAN